jgi:hypothetical protein
MSRGSRFAMRDSLSVCRGSHNPPLIPSPSRIWWLTGGALFGLGLCHLRHVHGVHQLLNLLRPHRYAYKRANLQNGAAGNRAESSSNGHAPPRANPLWSASLSHVQRATFGENRIADYSAGGGRGPVSSRNGSVDETTSRGTTHSSMATRPKRGSRGTRTARQGTAATGASAMAKSAAMQMNAITLRLPSARIAGSLDTMSPL